MLTSLLLISLAPVFTIAVYIYIRDKYEKEPFGILLKALFTGIILALPIVLVEYFISSFSNGSGGLTGTAYQAFAVASLSEEGFKYIGFFLIIWRTKNFNEKFDGIVYAVFISLGFAAIENLIYVFKGGINVGLVRAITAVPAHALFGTVMGYYFGLARFNTGPKGGYLILAFVMPFIWHGSYDFLLLGQNQFLLILFIPFIVFFWIHGFQRMREHSVASVFAEKDRSTDLPDTSDV